MSTLSHKTEVSQGEPTATALPALLTVHEVAAACRVTTSTVWRWADLGLLPRIRVGAGSVRFTVEDVHRLMTTEK